MISLYKKTETDFSHNGITLMPTVCTVHEVAGGAYELHMEHPFDEQERYKELFEDMIIQAPVPPFHREQITMPDVKVYLVNADNTPLYTKLPYYQRIKDTDIAAVKANPGNYAYRPEALYNRGALVAYPATADGKIYRCMQYICHVTPGTNASIWAYVTTVSGVYGVQVSGEYTDTLASGTRVFKLGDASGGYMRVRVIVNGASKEGWVELGKLTETSDTESGKVYPAKDIDKQLFRIYNVTSEDDLGTVVVEARHISYDFASNCLYECELKDATASDAISMIQGTLIDKEEPDERVIATNIVTGDRISEDWSFRNPVNALLGQDDGLVPLTDAKLLRDNKDFFILDNTLYLNEHDAAAGVMEGYFKLGNVTLLSRPKISAADMVSAGWTGVENGQTVYTQNYKAAPGGQTLVWSQNIIINITPIVSAERVLSPAELGAYVDNLLSKKSVSEILAQDAKDKPTGSNLVLWVQSGFADDKWQESIDRGALFRELLRKLQRVYYYDRTDQMPSLAALQSFDPSITLSYAESKITLEYGNNLTGVQWGRNVENVITRIVPRSHLANDGWLYLDEVYVDSEHINDYPFHRIETMDCGYTVGQEREKPDGTKAKWTEDEVKEQMRQDARDRFTKQHVDSVTISLSVEFLLLGDSEEYKQFRGLQRLNIYDLVTVDARRSGIIHMAQVTEYEYDCILGRYNSVKVGTVNKFSRRRGGRLSYGSYTPELAALITSAGVDMSDGNDEGYKPNGGAVDPIMTPVIDDLTHTDTNKALSANMGKYLNEHKIDTSEKGANGGVAELDSAGRLPAYQIPSYVDNMLVYDSVSSFPETGEDGKVYVARDTGYAYRWDIIAYWRYSPSLAAAYDHAYNKGAEKDFGLYKFSTNREGHVDIATAVQKSDITALGIPGQDTTYGEATSSTYGLIKIGYPIGGDDRRRWPLFLDSDGKAYVYIWGMSGASANYDGNYGLVPKPLAGDQDRFLQGDGTWGYISNFQPASQGNPGKRGLVPAPQADEIFGYFLQASGTWAKVPIPLADSDTRGGVRVGYTTDAANRNYAVQLYAEQMYVNVPWENTWRGIQNNLTSDSTTDSLSAAQGKVLNTAIANINSKLIPYTDAVISDMNSIAFTAGFPYLGRWVGSQTSNAPITNNQGVVFGYASSANYETQWAMDNSGYQFTRGKVGGTWGNWINLSKNLRISDLGSIATLDALKTALTTRVTSMPGNSFEIIRFTASASYAPFVNGISYFCMIQNGANGTYVSFYMMPIGGKDAIFGYKSGTSYVFTQAALFSKLGNYSSSGMNPNDYFTQTGQIHCYIPAANSPTGANAYGMLVPFVGDSNNGAQLFIHGDGASVRRKNNGTVGSWMNLALKSDIINPLGDISGSGTVKNITVPNNSRNILIGMADAAAHHLMLLVSATSNGTVIAVEIHKGSAWTIATSTNKLTLTKAGTTVANLFTQKLSGSALTMS